MASATEDTAPHKALPVLTVAFVTTQLKVRRAVLAWHDMHKGFRGFQGSTFKPFWTLELVYAGGSASVKQAS